MDSDEQCRLGNDYIGQQWEWQWDSGLLGFCQREYKCPDGDVDHSRADVYREPIGSFLYLFYLTYQSLAWFWG